MRLLVEESAEIIGLEVAELRMSMSHEIPGEEEYIDSA